MGSEELVPMFQALLRRYCSVDIYLRSHSPDDNVLCLSQQDAFVFDLKRSLTKKVFLLKWVKRTHLLVFFIRFISPSPNVHRSDDPVSAAV